MDLTGKTLYTRNGQYSLNKEHLLGCLASQDVGTMLHPPHICKGEEVFSLIDARAQSCSLEASIFSHPGPSPHPVHMDQPVQPDTFMQEFKTEAQCRAWHWGQEEG